MSTVPTVNAGGGGVRERDRAKKRERDERVQGDRLTYRRTLTE
jgi:hypothetical protein